MNNNFQARADLHKCVYMNDEAFNSFLTELSNESGSTITNNDVIRSSNGVRINLKEKQVNSIENCLKNVLEKELEEKCNYKSTDNINFSYLYNLTHFVNKETGKKMAGLIL